MIILSEIKKEKTKRYFTFKGTNVRIEIVKVTAVKSDIDFIFHLDRLEKDKDESVPKCRLTYNAVLFPDFSKIDGITIERVD